MDNIECRYGDSEKCGITDTERRMAEKSGLDVEFIHGIMDLFEVTFDEVMIERGDA
jgi:Mg2+/Co2+ transporter CorB